MVIKEGFDPGNSKAMEEIIKKKNANIIALKKQLKLPAIEDPWENELGEIQLQKQEMLKLLVEQSAQIEEMDAEMDKLIKEKEQNLQLVVVPLDAVPIASLLQTSIPTTSITTRTSSSTIIPTLAVDDSIKFTESMENMSIQGEEIKKLRHEVKVLQEKKLRLENSLLTEVQRSQTLSQRLQKMEKDSAMGNTLAQVKENIWNRINEDMIDIWRSIQIIFEQQELIQRSNEAIEEVKKQLGDKPREATELIKFLNSKNKQELEELEIEDRTETILEVKKVLTKRNIMRHLEEKCQIMDTGVQRLFTKLEPLYKK